MSSDPEESGRPGDAAAGDPAASVQATGDAAASVQAVVPGVRRVLAPNPGPMTLDGTNTWLLGHEQVLVVDPGPGDPAHLDRVLAAAGEALAGVVVTHRHPDHTDALADPRLDPGRTGLPVLAADPAWGQPVTPQALRAACDLVVEPLATPGHTDDSLSLVLPGVPAVLTGDTVLGRGTSVVAHPDGRLADYLASLDTLRRLARSGPVPWLGLPGHGPLVTELSAALDALLAHRHERLAEVRHVLGELGVTADPADEAAVTAVVGAVYPGLTGLLAEAARRTTVATLAYLSEVPS